MKSKVQAFFKKIWYYIQLVDGLWSVPLMFVLFWIAGILLQFIFGYGTGVYDVSFWQPLFLAGGIVIGATNFAVGGLYFTFRGLYRYIYGQKRADGNGLINYSKKDWTKLTEPQRYAVAFIVFLYYVSAIIIVYLKLV